MKLHSHTRALVKRSVVRAARTLAIATPLVFATLGHGQTPAQAPKEEEVLELSPFIVASSSDEGWRATQTLAGSRLKTDFADVASQISVMTPEFLRDMGALDSNDAFLYSVNTETEAEQAGATTQFMGSGAESNNPASRTRGAKGGTTTTKNFFRTDIPNNFYNSSESGLTIASGPNAILFGLGASGGLADTGYNRAQMRRIKGSLSLTTDLEGSLISSLDYNQPLIKDKLAARVAILESQKKFPIKPAYEDDKRFYGTVGWALNDKVRFDVLYEYMDRETSRPVYFAPTDYVTPWTNPGLGNRTPYNLPDVSPATVANAALSTNPAYWANPGSTAYLNNWTSQELIGPAYTYGATDSPGIYYYRFTPTVRKAGTYLRDVTKQLPGLNDNFTLINEAEYPFSKYSHYGASVPSRAIGKRFQGQMMVNLAKDLFLEASFGSETNSQKSYSLYNGTNAVIEIDPSAYAYNKLYVPLDPTTTVLPTQAANRAANAAARTSNSNLGKLFVTSLQNGAVQERTIDEARVSLAYLFDAQKQFGKSWLRHLGAHQFSGNIGYSEITRIGQGFRRAIKDNVDAAGNRTTPANIGIAAANAVGATTWMDTGNSNSRLFRTRVYIDPNNPDTRYDKGILAGLGQDPWGSWTFNDATGTPFNVGLFDLGGANGANNSGAAKGIHTDDLSKAFSWQGYLLKNRLVLTYGKRRDSVRSKLPDLSTTTLARRPDGLYPYMSDTKFVPYASVPIPTFVNETKSVVLHPLKGTRFDYFSLHYNESTNNEAEPAEKWDMNGLAARRA